VRHLSCLLFVLLADISQIPTMAASKFISDAAIRFKLGRAPLSELLTDSNSVAKRPGR
jgi:hypothetical protein